MVNYVKAYCAAGVLMSNESKEGGLGCQMVVVRQRRRPYSTRFLNCSGRQSCQHHNSAKNETLRDV